MAEFAEAGFDTFMETENGFEAYAEENKPDRALIEDIQKKYDHVKPLLLRFEKIEKQNWNEEWEKNVDPIFIEDQVLVRAEFHKIEKKFPYEIIITPKMSFGTGHHQTTWLMLRNQLSINHQNAHVMDAGCGTGILSVMAIKLGASNVEAFDIDEWSVPNAKENAEVNGANGIHIQQGTVRDFKFKKPFDIILANINKNVLIDEMKEFSKQLAPGGHLLLSGFYVSDINDLLSLATQLKMHEVSRSDRETWAALLLRKE
jgi:ribosomal protein L11 methyltransferase